LSNLPNRRKDSGPVFDYLVWLSDDARKNGNVRHLSAAKEAIRAIKAVASTEAGAIMLDLLKKSTLEFALPPSTDARALEAHNAQAFIFLDLARIATNELDEILDLDLSKPSGRRGRRGAGSGDGNS
jgi:hypothetical protein